MTAKIVSWDIDELNTQKNMINNYLKEIHDELTEEKNIQETVASSFQSPAGMLYQQHLEGNIQNIAQIADEVEVLMQDLSKVISEYETCENDVDRKVQELISSLQ